MKKILICILALALLFAGCSNTNSLPDDTAVLLAGDEVLLTMGDVRKAVIDAEVSDRDISEDDLFIELAEISIAAYLAEQMSLDIKDDAYWQEEYDSYMSAIEDTEVYPGMLDHANELMSALSMSPEEFRDWNVFHAKREYAAELLLTDIASCYNHITDPITMSETIRFELVTMSEMYGMHCEYPSLEGHIFTFETLT